jgi:heptosyltransferase-1
MHFQNILIVRLGAMGDILHALPAAATLKHAWPGARLSWAVHPKWTDLLQGNGLVDDLVFVERSTLFGLVRTWKNLRSRRFDLAVDFQGLIQSALVATVSRAGCIYGFEETQARERLAAHLYTGNVHTDSRHVVDKNLEIASAAGAMQRVVEFPLPQGRLEGALPAEPYLLASPFAGWESKQWPLEHYRELARLSRRELGMPLVLNGAPGHEAALRSVEGALVHLSSVAGLIWATRRAAAVVGVDSGPLHLAAALDKPGVAIFGPTDPARNGPYSQRIAVLRSEGVPTSYARESRIHPAMRAITPAQAIAALRPLLAAPERRERTA